MTNFENHLDLPSLSCYNGSTIEFSGRCMQETVKTTKGVTLLGFRKDEDCIRTELWRRPLYAEAEGASVQRKLSGKRTKNNHFELFLSFLRTCCMPSIFYF